MHGISRWHVFIIRRGQDVVGFYFVPTRIVASAMALTAHYVNRLHPFTSSAPSIAVHGSCLPVNSDRFGFRGDRLRPLACLHFPPTPLLRHGAGPFRLHLRSQTLFDGYVTAFAATPPASGCWHASTPLSTRNLRLLFRAVDDGLLRFLLHSHDSHTDSHVPPTHRGRSRQHSMPRQFPLSAQAH